jgi:predicted patatin/cPLA2 family phospholipase
VISPLDTNITDVALVLEGGSMRVSYNAPLVVKLIEQQLWFDYVSGVSAGASHALNYLSRDAERTRRSFVELGNDPQMGSWFTWLQGKGRLNAEYIYQHTAAPGEVLPFDFETFAANPATMRFSAFDVEAGEEVWWTKDDCATLTDLMLRVRASSSMPILMPPTFIDGRMYADGACGVNAGIPLGVAQADGYERFLIVLSQPRKFTKIPDAPHLLFRTWLREHPKLIAGMIDRTARYNRLRAEIAELEASGKAYVFYSESIPYPNTLQNLRKLRANYNAGARQSEQELPRMLKWLRPYISR